MLKWINKVEIFEANNFGRKEKANDYRMEYTYFQS